MEHLSKAAVHVDVENIGGIDEASVTLPPGVSILTGRNATNRTSFLQALMAGLGSRKSSLKGDADEGSVSLEIGDETYRRTLTRRNGSVEFDGTPYLDDPEIADLFAFLLENNNARRAVERGEDLREIIMRPIDTDSIDAEIRSCKRERDDLADEIERLDELERDLPDLEAKRREKRQALEDAESELEAVRAELDEHDTGVEESRTRKQELEAVFERVREARSELENLEFDLETERSTLEELLEEREEIRETVDTAEDPEDNPDRLAGRIDELRRRKRSLDGDINELGSVIGFNEDMMGDAGIDMGDDVIRDDPTEALTADEQTVCWTCGSEVELGQIEETLDRLRELRSDRLDERNDVRAEIQELTDRQSAIRERQREVTRAQDRLDTINTEIKSTRARISQLEDEIESKNATIEELEAEAESIDIDDYDEALELHREANGIELRIERLEEEIDEIDAEIEDREAAVQRRADLKSEREQLSERLTELRTRVDRIEENAVEEFNEHMDSVLDILNYDNLDRIWIDHRETEVRDGRRKVTRTRFDLHIVRSSSDGTVYEDTIDHLSESEREVTGLIFALAGYLVHDVHETVPFVVLDSLEAIDSERIADIVGYFEEHVDYCVAALLPEDADALAAEHEYIEQIG